MKASSLRCLTIRVLDDQSVGERCDGYIDKMQGIPEEELKG